MLNTNSYLLNVSQDGRQILRMCEFRIFLSLYAICLHRGVPKVFSARPLTRCRLAAWLRRTSVISEIIQNGRQIGSRLVLGQSHVSGSFVYIRGFGGTVRIRPNQAWVQGVITPCNRWRSCNSKIKKNQRFRILPQNYHFLPS